MNSKETQEGEDMERDIEGGWDVDDEDLDLPDLVRNTICRRGMCTLRFFAFTHVKMYSSGAGCTKGG